MTALDPLATSEAQVLAAMRDGQWHDSHELEQYGRRFAARLHDAQKAGRIQYTCRRKEGTNRYEYRLTTGPQSPVSGQPRSGPPQSRGGVSRPESGQPCISATVSYAGEWDNLLPRVPKLRRCEKCGGMRFDLQGPHGYRHGPNGTRIDCVGEVQPREGAA